MGNQRLPTFDHWLKVEFPQLTKAYTDTHGGNIPPCEWTAFQTYRRYVEPEAWPFNRMLEWELNGGKKGPIVKPSDPNLEPLSVLKIDGPVFRKSDNTIWRHKGFTSFKLLNLFEHGKDIRPIIDEYDGYNAPRVFLYTPVKDWKEQAWDFPELNAALDFVRFCNSRNLYPKICLATDDDQNRIEQIKELVQFLNGFEGIQLLYEAVNEPFIHDKLDPSIFKNVLSGSKFLYSSGIYKDNKKFFGQYWLDHSARDGEWYRKGGKSLYEAFNGGGPSFLDEPALRMACVEDEPIRPDQMGYDIVNMYAYAASCALMGAGATFHSAEGRFSRLLNDGEKRCKDAFLAGLNVFPVDTSLSIHQYDRIVEPGNEPSGDNVSGRTYIMGNHSIRIHQKGTIHPQSGWKPLDDFGVAYGR